MARKTTEGDGDILPMKGLRCHCCRMENWQLPLWCHHRLKEIGAFPSTAFLEMTARGLLPINYLTNKKEVYIRWTLDLKGVKLDWITCPRITSDRMPQLVECRTTGREGPRWAGERAVSPGAVSPPSPNSSKKNMLHLASRQSKIRLTPPPPPPIPGPKQKIGTQIS